MSTKRQRERARQHKLEKKLAKQKIGKNSTQNIQDIQVHTKDRNEDTDTDKPFPLTVNLEEKLREWSLPTKENPRKEKGVLWYAEAQNNSGFPHIAIRALIGNEIPKQGFHKARMRGYMIWAPSWMNSWTGKVTKKSDSRYFDTIPEANSHESALKNLLSALS